MTEHLPEARLESYRLRRGPEAEMAAAAQHLAECPECREKLLDMRTSAFVTGLLREPAAHLTYEELERYVDGQADDVDRELVETHLASCAECSADVQAVQAPPSAPSVWIWRPRRETWPVDDDTVPQRLREILWQHGPAVATDAAALAGYLEDLQLGHAAEVTAILQSVRAGVPQNVQQATAAFGERIFDELRERLVWQEGLTERAAEWTLQTWGAALNVPIPPADAEAQTAATHRFAMFDVGPAPGAPAQAMSRARMAASPVPPEGTPVPRRRRRWPWILLGLVVLVAVIAWLVWRG